jgi:hypothetical protein
LIKEFYQIIKKYVPREQLRRLIGGMALELGYGSVRFLSETFGVSEEFVSKGRGEVESGLAEVPRTSACGTKKLIDKLRDLLKGTENDMESEVADDAEGEAADDAEGVPASGAAGAGNRAGFDLESDIREIIDPCSSADPKVRGPWAYCSIPVREILERLRDEKRYPFVPSATWMYGWLNDNGYWLRTVKKALPKKVVPESGLIFTSVAGVNDLARGDDSVAVLSIDCKASVRVGLFARHGKTRVGAEGHGHDFKPDAVLVPFGILDEKGRTATVTMTDGPATADFIADSLAEWLDMNGEGKTTLVIHLDNGPECNSRRTQFKKRIVELAAEKGIDIILSYYPPYQSKFNPIERFWGSLERHWSGAILRTVKLTLAYARSTRHNGHNPVVEMAGRKHSTGVKVPKRFDKIYEGALERVPGVEKWFVLVNKDIAARAVAEAALLETEEASRKAENDDGKAPGKAVA